MSKIIAFGNPLLDTTVKIVDDDLLQKYNLKEDEQIEFSKDQIKSLFNETLQYEHKKTAGGCAQNTMRVLQWLMQKKCQTYIIGSVGKDEQGKLLKDLLEKDGVTTRYSEQEDYPTGLTIALVKDASRCLVAHIGAAELFSIEDIQNEIYSLTQGCDFVYVEGFFLTKRYDVSKYVLDKCSERNIPIIFNISAKYVCEVAPAALNYFLEHSYLIFGNKREFESVCEMRNVNNIDTLAQDLLRGSKTRFKYQKILVITNAANDVVCLHSGGITVTIPVPLIDKSEIKDTTGAGDAFVAGFIAGLLENKSILECLKAGCYSSRNIIKQVGCTIPNYTPNSNISQVMKSS